MCVHIRMWVCTTMAAGILLSFLWLLVSSVAPPDVQTSPDEQEGRGKGVGVWGCGGVRM